MTITEFILARVAEDEEVARFAYPPPWVQHDAFVYIGQADDVTEDDEPSFYINGGTYAGQRRTATHAARHDPARVLAECEAMRTIVAQTWHYEYEIDGEWGSNRTIEEMKQAGVLPGPLRALAAIWADHDDYREEWRA